MFSKIRVDIIYLFLTGVLIGFIWNVLLGDNAIQQADCDTYPAMRQTVNQNYVNKTSNYIKEVKKIRILCFVLTMPKSHTKRAAHIQNTWQKHCDKLIFASTLADINLGSLGLNVSADYNHIWGKVKLMYQYIYKNFLDKYEWFFKGKDDTFLVPENLKFLLAPYSAEDPIYFGHKYNMSSHKWGYLSGGSGYTLSQNAVRIFVEKVLTNDSSCNVNCDSGNEDWDMSICLSNANIYAGDARDMIKQERFLPFKPEQHLLGSPGQWWYWERKYYYTDEGLDCCSNYTISFHNIGPTYMYKLYYFTYHVKAYGIEFRFPSPQKHNFSDVINGLQFERFNSSFRGY